MSSTFWLVASSGSAVTPSFHCRSCMDRRGEERIEEREKKEKKREMNEEGVEREKEENERKCERGRKGEEKGQCEDRVGQRSEYFNMRHIMS